MGDAWENQALPNCNAILSTGQNLKEEPRKGFDEK